MALYPGAVKKLIPPGSNDPKIVPRLVLLHVAVFLGPSLYDYFKNRSGGVESHFYIRLDGTIEQYRDTDYEADANYRANPFAISIETEGMGDGKWTLAQLESIMKLLLWCREVHGIPLRVPTLWNGDGVSYHSRFAPWSPVAKSCPGANRIVQYKKILVPWMKNGEEEMKVKDIWKWDGFLVPAIRQPDPAKRKKNPRFQSGTVVRETWINSIRAVRLAHEANQRTKRIEAALKEFSKTLPATVHESMEKALTDAVIDVDIDINHPDDA